MKSDVYIIARMNICQKINNSDAKPCVFYNTETNSCSIPKQPCDEFDNEVDKIMENMTNNQNKDIAFKI